MQSVSRGDLFIDPVGIVCITRIDEEQASAAGDPIVNLFGKYARGDISGCYPTAHAIQLELLANRFGELCIRARVANKHITPRDVSGSVNLRFRVVDHRVYIHHMHLKV